MADPTPRWQFKLSDLFVACSLVALIFPLSNALPLKSGYGDFRTIPGLVLTAWIGSVVQNLRTGRWRNQPRAVGALLIGPFLGAVINYWLLPYGLRDSVGLVSWVYGICFFSAGGIALSWMYTQPRPR